MTEERNTITAAASLPPGTVRQFADRVCVHTSTADVDAIAGRIPPVAGGLVLVPRSKTGEHTLRQRIAGLGERGYHGPVAWDPGGYRCRVATLERPFVAPAERKLDGPAGVVDQLDHARGLGAHVVGTATGWIDVADPDVLKRVCEIGDSIDRTDFWLTLPLDIGYLNDAHIEQTIAIVAAVRRPVALILGGQFDPLAGSPRQLVRNLRALTRAARWPALLRTDFAGLDAFAHGAFMAAIGTSAGYRHAVDPREQPKSFNIKDHSPSVLIPELHCWWKGQKIALTQGRYSVRKCHCVVCDGQSLGRFLTADHRTEARAHDLATWSAWTGMLLAADDRADFWRNKCIGAVSEHDNFSEQIGKVVTPSPTLKAWASLPAHDRSSTGV